MAIQVTTTSLTITSASVKVGVDTAVIIYYTLPAMAENPIKEIREEKEVTQHELALAAGVSVSTVRNIENGEVGKINEKLLDFLEDKGYDVKELVETYQEWLEARRKQVEKKF